MEAVQKAVSDAVHAVRNSPLLRRRFGGRDNTTEEVRVEEPSRAISPVKDRTPFIQGFSYRVEYLGKAIVEAGQEQDHGCTDRAVALLWTENGDLGKAVSVKVTTSNVRIKLVDDGTILYDFPVLRISYVGLDGRHKQAVSFVAKEDNRFSCYVFKATSSEKAYALALSISKAFYLACQIVQEQQGLFPPTPQRDVLFEPQREDDTKVSPMRPTIPGSPPIYRIQTQPPPTSPVEIERETTDQEGPAIQVSRPSVTSMSSSIASSIDDDFYRLARSRSNPDILRSTLETDAVTHPSLEVLHLHADPASRGASPSGTPSGSTENLLGP